MPSVLRSGTILLIFATSVASAQSVAGDLLPRSGEGRDFWICFQRNYRNTILDQRTHTTIPAQLLTLRLVIASQYSTPVTVQVPGIGFARTIEHLRPGTVEEITIPDIAQVTGSDRVEKLAVHVTSEAPVSVVALNTRYQTTDTYAAIPVEALGSEYRVVGYRWTQNDLLSQLAVVATQDSTVVRIVPSWYVASEQPQPLAAAAPGTGRSDVGRDVRAGRREGEIALQRGARLPVHDGTVESRAAGNVPSDSVRWFGSGRPVTNVAAGPGDTLRVVLSRGEVYQARPLFTGSGSNVCDLTGSLVLSNKPVAVFSGHNCAYVPDLGTKACNMLAEQMPPLHAWGRHYVVGTLKERSSSVVRMLASRDSTRVEVTSRDPASGSDAAGPDTHVAILSAGKFHELNGVTGELEVRATQPVLVVQYAPGFGNGDDVGDPMMILVPPVEQFGTVFLTTAIDGTWRHYVNVIAPTSSLATLSVDGGVVDQTLFQEIGSGGYSVGAVPVSPGQHIVAGTAPFGLYSYGVGFDDNSYDAYGHGGGQLYLNLDAPGTGSPAAAPVPDLGSLTPEE